MIVDARAINYNEMVNLVTGKPINLPCELNSPETEVQPFDKIAIVSITDIGMQRIFEQSIADKVCSLVFNDVEPKDIPNFTPSESEPEFMTDKQAQEIVEFIDHMHSLSEKILLMVNCVHGMCRSGAVVNYVGHICSLGFWNMKKRNPHIVPNYWVEYQLFRKHFQIKTKVG
jgi:predicted protein tyrosine phosphatase